MPARDWASFFSFSTIRKIKVFGFSGIIIARLKSKGFDVRADKEWCLQLHLSQHGETHLVKKLEGLTD